METQTDNGDCLYLLTVFSHNVYYADSVCFFTNYERAVNVKERLQEKIDARMKVLKESRKEQYCWVIPEYARNYTGNPTAVVLKVPYSELDQPMPEYKDIVENTKNPRPLKEFTSSGLCCWFDFLTLEKKAYDEKIGALCETSDAHNAEAKIQSTGTQTRFPSLFVVTDFFIDENYLNSKLIGVFTDPELAQDAQAKVGASYGLDVVFRTWNDKHCVELVPFVVDTYRDKQFVELVGLVDDKKIDPEEVNYYRMRISV